ncbi:dTMP kinase [Candidatus Magnetomonas plexicatena]|nr:dTMP kinase [Nitrospirales bacterium LBB_01]
MEGVFISIEGTDGSGKSTQVRLVAEALRIESGLDVVETFEPGGTEIGMKIREILIDPKTVNMSPITELMLFYAARAQHAAEVIHPALRRGAYVITDRFSDSTIAYQAYGRGINPELIKQLDALVLKGFKPDLTIVIDLDVTTGLSRKKSASKADRLEMEELLFHERVREGFLDLSKTEPLRFKVIDGSYPVETLTKRIVETIKERFNCL